MRSGFRNPTFTLTLIARISLHLLNKESSSGSGTNSLRSKARKTRYVIFGESSRSGIPVSDAESDLFVSKNFQQSLRRINGCGMKVLPSNVKGLQHGQKPSADRKFPIRLESGPFPRFKFEACTRGNVDTQHFAYASVRPLLDLPVPRNRCVFTHDGIYPDIMLAAMMAEVATPITQMRLQMDPLHDQPSAAASSAIRLE